VDQGTVLSGWQPGQLGDLELTFLEDRQEVVGQVDIPLVEFIDEQDARVLAWQERGAERAEPDELADVWRLVAPVTAQRRLPEPTHRVILVQGVGERGAAVHRPVKHLAELELVGDGIGERGLPGPRVSRHKQGPSQMQGSVDDVNLRLVDEIGTVRVG
jgi:hypothetical protein